MCAWSTLFVNMSDGYRGPGTFHNGSDLRACCSWIHSTSSSTCLSLVNPLRCTIPMAAFVSMPTPTLTPESPKSSSNVETPSARVDAQMTTYSSDSPDDFAKTACVFA